MRDKITEHKRPFSPCWCQLLVRAMQIVAQPGKFLFVTHIFNHCFENYWIRIYRLSENSLQAILTHHIRQIISPYSLLPLPIDFNLWFSFKRFPMGTGLPFLTVPNFYNCEYLYVSYASSPYENQLWLCQLIHIFEISHPRCQTSEPALLPW